MAESLELQITEYELKVAEMEMIRTHRIKEIIERYKDRKLKEQKNDLSNRLKNK